MALQSLQWDRDWRVRSGCERPIGWRLNDSSGQPVGRVLDLLADDRTRQVVYAVCELDGAPPVLVDADRLTLDAEQREVQAAMSRAALMVLSPATWWRRPAAMRREVMEARAADRSDKIVVPVYGEQVVVEKRPVVIEEIIISKRPEVRRAQVRATVRREQVAIEERRRERPAVLRPVSVEERPAGPADGERPAA